jgi:hypothetical protein
MKLMTTMMTTMTMKLMTTMMTTMMIIHRRTTSFIPDAL